MNVSPSLACDSPLDYRIKSMLFADMLHLVGVRLRATSKSAGKARRNQLTKRAGAHTNSGLDSETSAEATFQKWLQSRCVRTALS